jgi:hypothetical protein
MMRVLVVQQAPWMSIEKQEQIEQQRATSETIDTIVTEQTAKD